MQPTLHFLLLRGCVMNFARPLAFLGGMSTINRNYLNIYG